MKTKPPVSVSVSQTGLQTWGKVGGKFKLQFMQSKRQIGSAILKVTYKNLLGGAVLALIKSTVSKWGTKPGN